MGFRENNSGVKYINKRHSSKIINKTLAVRADCIGKMKKKFGGFAKEALKGVAKEAAPFAKEYATEYGKEFAKEGIAAGLGAAGIPTDVFSPVTDFVGDQIADYVGDQMKDYIEEKVEDYIEDKVEDFIEEQVRNLALFHIVIHF